MAPKKQYRRKNNYKSLKKDVATIKKELKPEIKLAMLSTALQGSQPFAGSQVSQLLSNINQGVAGNNRIGSKIHVRYIKYSIYIPASMNIPQKLLRIMVFSAKDPRYDQSVPSAYQYVKEFVSKVDFLHNYKYVSVFKDVLLKPTQSSRDRVLHGTIKLNKDIQYETSSTAYTSRNEIFVAVITNKGDTNTDNLYFNYNVSFTDM